MKQKNFLTLVSLVFLLVAMLHLLRVLNGWELVLNGSHLPMWGSWLAVVLGTWLSYKANKLK